MERGLKAVEALIKAAEAICCECVPGYYRDKEGVLQEESPCDNCEWCDLQKAIDDCKKETNMKIAKPKSRTIEYYDGIEMKRYFEKRLGMSTDFYNLFTELGQGQYRYLEGLLDEQEVEYLVEYRKFGHQDIAMIEILKEEFDLTKAFHIWW